jgi:hypothetical protein
MNYYAMKLNVLVQIANKIGLQKKNEDVRRSGCIDPRFLELGNSWR